MPSYEDILIRIIEKIIEHKISILLSTDLSPRNKYEHLKNMFSIVINIDIPSIYRTAYMLEKYMQTIDQVKKLYEVREATYITIHYNLRKNLYEEVEILKIQGAETLLSRILFLAASINKLIGLTPLPSKYLLNLNKILSMPVPPSSEEARTLDLINPGNRICIFPGSINLLWIYVVVIKELMRKGYNITLYVSKESYEDSLYRGNVTRYINELDSIDIFFTEPCREILCNRRCALSIIANIPCIYYILDNLETLDNLGNTLLVFNPIKTPLEETLGLTPIVISVESLRNILFKEPIR